jgi:hypothetical protein
LLPLVGKGITGKNLHDAAEFLAGACSCEIKDQNPGFDLLLAADWEALLSPGGTPLAAASTSRMTATHEPTEAVLVPIPKGSSRSRAAAVGASTAAHTDTSAKSELPARYLGIAARGLAVAGAIGAAVAAAFVTRRRIA